nr:helix-turn-helix transcriptional regulator [Protofrankia coriariae]
MAGRGRGQRPNWRRGWPGCSTARAGRAGERAGRLSLASAPADGRPRAVRHDRAGAAAGRAGVRLSREQVYRLVTGTPERLSPATLAALCDILGCAPGDLVEPYRQQTRRASAPAALPTADSPTPPRPRRAQVAGPPAPRT